MGLAGMHAVGLAHSFAASVEVGRSPAVPVGEEVVSDALLWSILKVNNPDYVLAAACEVGKNSF